MLGLTEAGQPSMHVEPDPHELPGSQLASGPRSLAVSEPSGELDASDASEPSRSVPASPTGRQVHVFGTGLIPQGAVDNAAARLAACARKNSERHPDRHQAGPHGGSGLQEVFRP